MFVLSHHLILFETPILNSKWILPVISRLLSKKTRGILFVVIDFLNVLQFQFLFLPLNCFLILLLQSNNNQKKSLDTHFFLFWLTHHKISASHGLHTLLLFCFKGRHPPTKLPPPPPGYISQYCLSYLYNTWKQ